MLQPEYEFADIPEEQGEESDEGESPMVIDGSQPERSMYEPTPPSFGSYRHPAGPLWRRTPRKSIPPILVTYFQRPPLTIAWEARRQGWHVGGPSRTEAGESSRSSHHSTTGGDSTATIISGLVERLTQMEARVASTDHDLCRMTAQAHVLEVRVRVLEQDRDSDMTTLATSRVKLADARGSLTNFDTRMDGMQTQISLTDTLALTAASSAADAVEEVNRLAPIIERHQGLQ